MAELSLARRAGKERTGRSRPFSPGKVSSPFLSVATVHGVHDRYQGRDKVLSIFGSFVSCAGTASDVSGRFIYAMDWSD